MDEAGQALETACWAALLRAPRCVLAGDHLQLPPTIMSREAAAGGLEMTLLERAVRVLGGVDGGVCLLDTQCVTSSPFSHTHTHTHSLLIHSVTLIHSFTHTHTHTHTHTQINKQTDRQTDRHERYNTHPPQTSNCW